MPQIIPLAFPSQTCFVLCLMDTSPGLADAGRRHRPVTARPGVWGAPSCHPPLKARPPPPGWHPLTRSTTRRCNAETLTQQRCSCSRTCAGRCDVHGACALTRSICTIVPIRRASHVDGQFAKFGAFDQDSRRDWTNVGRLRPNPAEFRALSTQLEGGSSNSRFSMCSSGACEADQL